MILANKKPRTQFIKYIEISFCLKKDKEPFWYKKCQTLNTQHDFFNMQMPTVAIIHWLYGYVGYVYYSIIYMYWEHFYIIVLPLFALQESLGNLAPGALFYMIPRNNLYKWIYQPTSSVCDQLHATHLCIYC